MGGDKHKCFRPGKGAMKKANWDSAGRGRGVTLSRCSATSAPEKSTLLFCSWGYSQPQLDSGQWVLASKWYASLSWEQRGKWGTALWTHMPQEGPSASECAVVWLGRLVPCALKSYMPFTSAHRKQGQHFESYFLPISAQVKDTTGRSIKEIPSNAWTLHWATVYKTNWDVASKLPSNKIHK